MGPDAVPCYGHNMPFADRMDHESPDFYNALERDVDYLNAKHPVGLAIRLHELGDFFSLDYVSFWEMLLCSYPALNAFGYSHTTEAIDNNSICCIHATPRTNGHASPSTTQTASTALAFARQPQPSSTCLRISNRRVGQWFALNN